jgi:hypothetical protein
MCVRRKSKQWLLSEGIAGLQKKVKKGRGVTKVLIEERQRRVGAGGVQGGGRWGPKGSCGMLDAWVSDCSLSSMHCVLNSPRVITK